MYFWLKDRGENGSKQQNTHRGQQRQEGTERAGAAARLQEMLHDTDGNADAAQAPGPGLEAATQTAGDKCN